jgi:tRNA(fMet)-specific endonuclease VapC
MRVTGKYLLDTNIVIALFNEEQGAKDQFARSSGVCTSSIVIGELYFGAQKSSRVKQNVTRIDDFADNTVVIDCSLDIAREYGLIKKELRDKGKPVPDNDIWIAATARQHNLTLVTRDAHFAVIGNLDTERW